MPPEVKPGKMNGNVEVAKAAFNRTDTRNPLSPIVTVEHAAEIIKKLDDYIARTHDPKEKPGDTTDYHIGIDNQGRLKPYSGELGFHYKINRNRMGPIKSALDSFFRSLINGDHSPRPILKKELKPLPLGNSGAFIIEIDEFKDNSSSVKIMSEEMSIKASGQGRLLDIRKRSKSLECINLYSDDKPKASIKLRESETIDMENGIQDKTVHTLTMPVDIEEPDTSTELIENVLEEAAVTVRTVYATINNGQKPNVLHAKKTESVN